ncbi:hypothetical protein ACFS3C_26215 [Azotobacter vinelandii]
MDYKVRDFEVLGDRTTDDRVGMREAPGATRATESIHMPAGECRLVDTTAAPAPTLPLRATRPPAAGVTARLRAKRKNLTHSSKAPIEGDTHRGDAGDGVRIRVAGGVPILNDPLHGEARDGAVRRTARRPVAPSDDRHTESNRRAAARPMPTAM